MPGKILHHINGEEAGQSIRGSDIDAFFLDRAIDLAWLGAGKTLANPMVGSVVVKDGRVVGEGHHEAYGLDHAETVALKHAGDDAVGATLYATLEPCTHHGKTPPCVDHIMRSGVRRVVVCTLDPDPRMNGKGIEELRRRGIEVEVGNRAERALTLNLDYFKTALGEGCAVTLKMATTWDGRIASRPGTRDKISGSEAREHVQRLRAANHGVLVGIDTLLVDEPRLDCRLLSGVEPPIPIVLDSNLRFPMDYRWTRENRRFLVVTREGVPSDDVRRIERDGGTVLRGEDKDGCVSIGSAVDEVFRHGVSSILVEGGAKILTAFLGEGRWDVLHLFVSPAAFGPEGVGMIDHCIETGAAALAGVSRFSQDILASYLNIKTRDRLLGQIL